ncbi:MAG TPA: hypothetical protein VFE58_00980 [Tepidisphaeraceae bacterium]|jgi:predicted dehydrogenase|nr:hypothetical protein [Tepidisphaeraceae bacterium]
MPKRITFVDYNLNNFHANVYLKSFRGPLKDRGYEVASCHAMEEETGRAWATKNNVPYIADILQLNDQTDFYVVLAPGHPEKHLDLARLVLPFGKTTYIDKTFAPDLATAKEIFTLADQHRTPVQTTSALRYTAVQKRVKEIGRDKIASILALGGGSNFAEYAIHPVEMVVSCLGSGATSVKRETAPDMERLTITFTGNRTGTAEFHRGDNPFSGVLTTTDARTETIPVDGNTLFTNMASALADYFDAGKPLIDRAESLAVRAILDAAANPAALKNFVPLS